MGQAVGSLETKGFPPVLAAADAMVKAGRVTLVLLLESLFSTDLANNE